MDARRYKPEEIISKLREAEVLLSEGVSVGEVVRRLGVTKLTYYLCGRLSQCDRRRATPRLPRARLPALQLHS